jgi:peptidoglycan-associated lipoprotein
MWSRAVSISFHAVPVIRPIRKEQKMLKFKSPKTLLSIVVSVALLSTFVGCAVPKELVTANEAVEAARKAGKDKECPNEFAAVENLKNEAYAVCKPCDTAKAIALANQATDRASLLCPGKPAAPAAAAFEAKPAPAPAAKAPAAASTVSLSASPSSVTEGQCSTLRWSSTNASSVSIDPGVGRVDANGSKEVCPTRTTTYRASASGDGASSDASATVNVSARVVDKMTLHVNFDFNKATVRKPDDADLQKAIAFVKKYPEFKVSLEGYTDSIGSDAYNQGLSERRAAAVKDYLVAHGVDAARIQTSGHGKSDPVASNSTPEGRFKNRRVEVLILSQ